MNSSSTPKESIFSVKNQLVNMLGFQATWSLLQLFDSAIVGQKQPKTICKQVSVC